MPHRVDDDIPVIGVVLYAPAEPVDSCCSVCCPKQHPTWVLCLFLMTSSQAFCVVNCCVLDCCHFPSVYCFCRSLHVLGSVGIYKVDNNLKTLKTHHLFAESLLWHCYAVVFSLYFWRLRALNVGRHSKFMLIDWLIELCQPDAMLFSLEYTE